VCAAIPFGKALREEMAESSPCRGTDSAMFDGVSVERIVEVALRVLYVAGLGEGSRRGKGRTCQTSAPVRQSLCNELSAPARETPRRFEFLAGSWNKILLNRNT
jgi:hypothetical protein